MANKLTGNCFYCERHYDRLTRDHVTPRSKGGVGLKRNIVVSCTPCNGYKADWLPADYLLFLIHATPQYFIKNNLVDTVIHNVGRLIAGDNVRYYDSPTSHNPPKKINHIGHTISNKPPKTKVAPFTYASTVVPPPKVIAKIDLPPAKVKKSKAEPTADKVKNLLAAIPNVIYISNAEFANKEKILHRHFLNGKTIINTLWGIEWNTVNFHE